MSVQRVHPPPVHSPSGMISQVVTTDGERLVHLSGQVASDAEGTPVGPGDHAAQATQIVRNIEAALAAVGATRDDIVKETVYVVDYSPALLPAISGPLRAGVSQAPRARSWACPPSLHRSTCRGRGGRGAARRARVIGPGSRERHEPRAAHRP